MSRSQSAQLQRLDGELPLPRVACVGESAEKTCWRSLIEIRRARRRRDHETPQCFRLVLLARLRKRSSVAYRGLRTSTKLPRGRLQEPWNRIGLLGRRRERERERGGEGGREATEYGRSGCLRVASRTVCNLLNPDGMDALILLLR